MQKIVVGQFEFLLDIPEDCQQTKDEIRKFAEYYVTLNPQLVSTCTTVKVIDFD